MPIELVTVPCLKDNYAFLVHNPISGETLLVDAPEAPPIEAALDARGWILTDIFLTHHHPDHVDGLEYLRGDARVIGARADVGRLPALDLQVSEGQDVTLLGEPAQIIDVSGHTIGHIALHLPFSQLLFSADSLMALGCGRLFEGSATQMWQSLLKLRALPDETRVCSGHEYTQVNARFAKTIEPNNAALIARSDEIDQLRAKGLPTVPSLLGAEKKTNPFLRADQPELLDALGLVNAVPAEVFADIRKQRDVF